MFWGGFVFCFCCHGLGSVGCGGEWVVLGTERLGFWEVFPNARGGGPVVVVRGPVVFVVVVPQLGGGAVVVVFLW